MPRSAPRNDCNNPYEILHVHPRARAEVIHAAHRVLAGLHHPDKGGDASAFKRVNEAHDILKDDAKRAAYDRAANAVEGKVIGDFRVLSAIAEGGIGKTYKGEHVITGTPVCIKHCSGISPEHDEIMVNEAKAMWDLRHYAIPAVRNLIRLEDNSLALVMSYIPGPTLEQLVEKNGRLDPEHVAWITERILNALKYLHFHGIVHGDLKPQNVIVQPEDHTVVLVDFGLAMIKPTKTSAAAGYTDYFAPPEQVLRAPLIPETDFYSLGMTMLYALSGNMDAVAKKQVPSKVPDPMCDFIQRMLVRNTLDRPNWRKEDLCETIKEMRVRSFGRANSNMKPLAV